MDSRKWTKRAGAVLAAALVLAVPACSSGGEVVDLAVVTSVERPEPVRKGTPPAPGKPAPQCDPKASLRPSSSYSPGNFPAGSTMDQIYKRGHLIAGVDQNTYLFGFRDARTGAIVGFDIDMVNAVAKAIFGTVEGKVVYRAISSADRVPLLKNREVDIVVRTMTMNCDRWSEINFSSEYYTAVQKVLVDRSNPATGMEGLGGKPVCANTGSTSLKRIKDHPSKPVAVEVDNWSDCLVLLQQGQVAAVSTDDVILAGMVAQDPNLKMIGAQLGDEPYGIGIPQPAQDMTKFVNAVLDKVRSDGTWMASYNSWLGRTGQTAQMPQPKYKD
ncbi:glutamate ABC transporter substrate-binding protein [Herbihabitans rhizosphaerae]|nr:glutamate ABC transporter substrate-binding protein [Herbihabitans rhizosphaerae]